MIFLRVIYTEKLMKPIHPQHLKNLEKDIKWLEEIIQARYDFMQGSTTLQVAYEPVRFQVRAPEGDRVFKVQHLAASQLLAKKETVIPIYQDNFEHLITTQKDKQEYFAVLKPSAEVHINEMRVDDDWVKLTVPDTDSAYLIDQNLIVQGTNQDHLQGWVRLSNTNIPDSYHPDITLDEFNQIEHEFSPQLQKAIRPNIPMRQQFLQWADFYTNENIFAIPTPTLDSESSTYGAFIEENQLELPDRLLLILSLIHHLQPGKLDQILNDKFSPLDVGNTFNNDYPGLVPNGLMFIFFQAGHDLEKRLQAINFMIKDSILLHNNIVQMEQDSPTSPLMSSRLRLNPDYVEQFVLNMESN